MGELSDSADLNIPVSGKRLWGAEIAGAFKDLAMALSLGDKVPPEELREYARILGIAMYKAAREAEKEVAARIMRHQGGVNVRCPDCQRNITAKRAGVVMRHYRSGGRVCRYSEATITPNPYRDRDVLSVWLKEVA